MERSEPTLVPEWLKSTGSVTGTASSAHHSALSLLHSGNQTRKRSSKGTGDCDSPLSVNLEQTSYSDSRRSSGSNGLIRHPYSSFSRSNHGKDRDKEREWYLQDNRDRDHPGSVASILGGKVKEDILRRSRSMISGNQSDVWAQVVKIDSIKSQKSSHINRNSVKLSGSTVSSTREAALAKGFQSLGAEERQGVSDLGRVFSPGLPIGSSSVIAGEGWTSALAGIPPVIGSNRDNIFSVQQTAIATPVSGPLVSGLNMVEALTQASSRTLTAPQTQRLEELALKQSRWLIPMKPSASKASVLNTSDKAKSKTSARTVEMVVAAKSVQQQFCSSSMACQSLPGVRSDASKASHVGKFHVLKPIWENGVSSILTDVFSPTNNTSSRVANTQLAATPTSISAPLNLRSVECKTTSLAVNSGSTVERRPSPAQAQSRIDFFNLMRKKSSINTLAVVSSANTENVGEEIKEIATRTLVSHHSIGNGDEVNSNGNTCENAEGFPNSEERHLSPDVVDLEEEEARFLRSLGWEETTGEDESLTEEEINSFFEECMKLRPSLKLR